MKIQVSIELFKNQCKTTKYCYYSDAEIVEYASLGPKNYQVRLLSSSGGCNTVTKVRGFALRCYAAISRLDGNKFVQFVKFLLRGIRQAIAIPHFNILRTPQRQLYNTINCKILRNDVYRQRVAFGASPLSLPYGYTEDMYRMYVQK